MADLMQFDLVSPERRLASMEVSAVLIPGSDGDFTAMKNHAPTVASLRPGLLRVTGGGEEKEFVISGGFAEISDAGTNVLAERALPREEAKAEFFDGAVAEAEAALAKAGDEPIAKAAAELALNDLKFLQSQL